MIEILTEIRDGRREQIELYRTVTQHSVELQHRAVNRAENIGKLYRIAVAVSAVLIVGIIGLIFYLLSFIRR